uniref:hypothetical protein n=1 Tax=Ningiella ruwaisensis TaxID=2364274 RepID=UPI00109F4AF5|nr:hypothetical protein [Ningiella ruwaisensis]
MLAASANVQAVDVSEGYVITFDNFSPVQVNQVMVYATRFSDYEQYEILMQRGKDTKMHYLSEIQAPLLSHNFQQTFEELNWEVISQQEANQYQFSFVGEKPKPIPYRVW